MKLMPLRNARTALAVAALAIALSACSDSPDTLLVKAKDAIAKSESKTAEIHLKNLLQQKDDAEARYLLGTVHLKAGDVVSAEKEFQRALDGGYDRAKVAPALAQALIQLGRFQKVVDDFGKAVPEQPDGKANLMTTVGRAQLALGKTDAARSSFETALAAKGDYAPARVALIALQAGKGDLPGANTEVDKVLMEQPNSPDALALKGDLELALGRPKEAREYFRKAVAANPQDRSSLSKIVAIAIDLKELDSAQASLDDLKKLTGPAAGTMHLQALIHARQNKLEPARDAVMAALKAAPAYLPALALSAQVHLALNSLETAELHARKVLEAAPNSTVGYRLVAAIHIRKNAPDRALQLLEPALARGTKDATLYALAGEAALRANDAAKATKYFEQANKLDPKDARKATALAFAHIASGDKERGIAELQEASGMDAGATGADYALVMTHLRERQFDKALAAVDTLEKKQPDSALAANLRGTVLASKGDLAGARKAFELSLKRDPKFYPPTANLAQLDLRDRKFDAARQRFLTLLEKDPKNVPAMLALAQIAQGVSRLAIVEDARADAASGKPRDTGAKTGASSGKEALEWLKKAREADKASVPAALALAGWYVRNEQPRDAIPMLQEALSEAPEDIRLLDALGTAYMRSDQPNLAMETFEKILRVRPDSVQLHLRMGQLKMSRGELVGAMQNLRKAAELEPGAVEPKAAIAALHMRAGKPDEARKIAAELQKAQPKNPAGAALAGDIAMAERKFGDAATHYRKALAIDKDLPLQLKLHRALHAGGSTIDADKLLDGLIKESPDSLQLRMYAGDVEVGRKRWPQAVSHYEKVIAEQPGNALALNNAAWALYEMKDAKALDYAERAAAAAPQAAAILDTLGVILADRGDAQRGVQVLKQAVAAAPKAPQFRVHLAEAMIKAGDKAGAKSELETVLKEVDGGPIADKAKALQAQL